MVWRLAHALYLHDSFQSAPAMAFHLFLSLLPLLVFLGYVVGRFAQSAGVDAVMWPLFDVVPSTSAALVREEIERLAEASTLGPISLLGFLWIAAGGAHGLMDSLEIVVGAPRRSWWQKRLVAIGWVVVSMLALTAAAFGMVKWDARGHGAPFREGNPLALIVGVVIATLALAAFYWFSVSHRSRVRRRVLPGALVAIALGVGITWGFGFYVKTLARYAVYYGSLAAVAVLLIWLWLVCLAVLIGAELNAQLEGLRDVIEEPPPSTSSRS